jgi:hypothetical protein
VKICKRCGEQKPLEEFPLCKGKPRARCKKCHTNDARQWAIQNSEKYKARLKAWHKKNKPARFMGPPLPESIKRDRRLASKKKWREANQDLQKQLNREWSAKNKHIVQEAVRRRQACKLQRTPSWANREKMKAIYKEARRLTLETGIPHDVDHIVPLRGKMVSGLHCETNLQVLPRKQNRQKHNHFEDCL